MALSTQVSHPLSCRQVILHCGGCELPSTIAGVMDRTIFPPKVPYPDSWNLGVCYHTQPKANPNESLAGATYDKGLELGRLFCIIQVCLKSLQRSL